MLFIEKIEQKRIYIIGTIVISILIGIIYANFCAPKTFISSTSVLLLKKEDNSNKELENKGTIELTENLMSTFEEIIKSDLNIEIAKKTLNLTEEISSKNISVKRIANSDTFQIRVKSYNYDNAININSEIVKSFGNKIKAMNRNTELYIVDSAHIVNSNNIDLIISCVIISLIIGIGIDLIYIVFLMQIEKSIKNDKDIESNFSLINLASIPTKNIKKKANIELISSEEEKTITNKAFKKLRSNVQFLNVNSKAKNIILLTSCSESEGKSYVSANLAITYANSGKKVILIDTDLSKGKQDKLFNLPNNMGLSNFLANLDMSGVEIKERINSFIRETTIKNLNIITSGTVPPNSSELLSSNKFTQMLKDLGVFYDVIILDGTKILNKIDSLILSRYASSVIITSVANKTKKDDLWKAKKDIQNVGGRIIGIVLNKVKMKDETKKQKIYTLFKSIKEKIEKYIKTLKETNTQKLLTESTRKDTNIESSIQNENKIIANAIIDEEKENIKENEDKTKTENNINVKNEIKEDAILNKQDSKEDIIILDKEEIESVKTKNDKQNEITEENKVLEIIKTVEETLINCKDKIMNFYKSLKKNLKKEKNEIDVKESEKTSEKSKEKVNTNNLNENDSSKSNLNKENTVLVIVDSNNEICRAFSTECYTEKLVRGLDKTDGFIKAQYSSYLLKKRIEALMLMYSLTKKQAKRIDPLIYSTLVDYDDAIVLQEKKEGKKAEAYVLCMAKEYEKAEGESRKEYIKKCKSLRKEELYNLGIEIEYNIESLWKTSKMKLVDKIVMNNFAKIHGVNKVENNYYDEENTTNNYNINEKSKKTNFVELIKKVNPIKKIEEVKNNIVNVEPVKIKSVKEIAEEVENELNSKNNQKLENSFDINSNFSEIVINEPNEYYDIEMQKQEQRKEVEVFKKIQKEKNAKKRKEEKDKRRHRREKKIREREQQRKAKELEREKKMEEARIEEELLVDNLYPKTKNNKNL